MNKYTILSQEGNNYFIEAVINSVTYKSLIVVQNASELDSAVDVFISAIANPIAPVNQGS